MIDENEFKKQLSIAKWESYCEGQKVGYEKALSERPQGEWLKSDIPESTLAKCSICGFDCGACTYNFCPNCGADMRGGKNDE